MEAKTVIIVGEDEQFVLDGTVLPKDLVNVNLTKEIDEVVDGVLVHTYTVSKIPHKKLEGAKGKILS